MMTLKGGTSQACAVCKYQRRRCTKDCLLAPYFPADQPKVFQNAHRLFGVSNIMKILREVHPDQRDEAMKSIKYQSFIRSKFPVHGCCEVIWQLRYQLHHVTEELRRVCSQLAAIKLRYGGEASEKSDFTHHYLEDNALPFTGNEFLVNGGYNCNLGFAEGAEEMKPLVRAQTQHFPYYNKNENHYMGGKGVKPEMGVPQGFLFQQEVDVPQDYDEIPYDTIADDGQSYIEFKEACESSAESTSKDGFGADNELRTAAACFSLK